MKAKLSFLAPLSRGLALSLSLGLVITLVLAACGGDSGNNPKPEPGPGYSSGGVAPPKDAENLKIDGFKLTLDGSPIPTQVIIDGTVWGAGDNLIVKVTYSIPGGDNSWIKYQRSPLPSNGVVNVDRQRSFDLNDAKIDLKNENIPCGREFAVNVEARSELDSVATNGGTFTKECALTPSSGVELSSSSAASWKFGTPIEGQAYGQIDYPIGTGSFKILEDPDNVPPNGQFNLVDQPDVKITGGKIKLVTPCKDDGTSAGTDGDVQVGTAYSSKEGCLGSTPATSTNLTQIDGLEGLQPKQDYYLIYLDGSDSVYLLFFTAGEGGSVSKYPLKYIYWQATEKP
ncbi:MAG: hypothetical protein LBC87_12840 [Fibromonadaceae bacterium]|jgi:hypothetical protein|nr:hypothetical protein [Fibromonadaceae bacterium]